MTSIGYQAFSGCSSLATITIGSGVTSIGSQAFANCLDLSDVYCYAENVPSTPPNAFEGSYIEYATLHVPTASVDAYKAAEPWKNFKTIVGFDGSLPDTPGSNQCATPTIIILGNKVHFECETPGAEFISTLTPETETYESSNIILGSKPIIYTLTVYATAPGYTPSKSATVKISLSLGDLNGDGVIGIGDIVSITNIMAGKE